MSPTLILSFDLNDSVIKGLQCTLKNYYDKKKTKTKTKKISSNIAANITNKRSVLVFIWRSSNYVSKMSKKKTDSEKNMITLLHLGQSVHECIGIALDSITLLFFIISSTQDCALVMLGSSSQLTSTLGDRETLVFA